MSQIVSIHSFRGGTGKSNTTANVAGILASQGKRVGVIDTDIQSPGVHVLFGLGEDEMEHTLNDYLWSKCTIKEVAHDVTAKLGMPVSGKVYLFPCSVKAGEIARILREGYDVGLLNDGCLRAVKDLNLDVLIIDTHPGLNEETLLSVSISDALAVIMRPDAQDYQGTAVTVDVARKLEVPRMVLVVNKLPPAFSLEQVKARVEKLYQVEVAGVIPHSDDLMNLASEGVFSMRYPDHPVAAIYRQIAARLVV
jgi:MinD-like ATPase involved in chromosome partitioning or flagellar assembly